MLPPIVTQTVEHLTSSLFGFAVIALAGTAVAAVLARTVGGKSKNASQAIFAVVSFIALVLAVYYAVSKLTGGGIDQEH